MFVSACKVNTQQRNHFASFHKSSLSRWERRLFDGQNNKWRNIPHYL